MAPVKAAYRPFVSKYMIKFTPWTKIDRVDNVPVLFPRFVYNLSPLSELSSRVGSQLYFTGQCRILIFSLIGYFEN